GPVIVKQYVEGPDDIGRRKHRQLRNLGLSYSGILIGVDFVGGRSAGIDRGLAPLPLEIRVRQPDFALAPNVVLAHTRWSRRNRRCEGPMAAPPEPPSGLVPVAEHQKMSFPELAPVSSTCDCTEMLCETNRARPASESRSARSISMYWLNPAVSLKSFRWRLISPFPTLTPISIDTIEPKASLETARSRARLTLAPVCFDALSMPSVITNRMALLERLPAASRPP